MRQSRRSTKPQPKKLTTSRIDHGVPPRKVRTLVGLFRATIDTVGAKRIRLEFAKAGSPMEADLTHRVVRINPLDADFFFRSHKTAIAVFAEEIAHIETGEDTHSYVLWCCFVAYLDKLGIKPKEVLGHAVRRASFSRYCRKHNLV